MKFAAIASDDAILPVLQAIQALEHGEVQHVWGENDDVRSQMQTLAPNAADLYGWDELLEKKSVDYVVVAGVSDSVLTAAKQLLQAGNRILVVVSTSADAARIFDYTALWQEAPDRLLPIFSSGVDGISQEVLQQFDEEKFGKLWKINFQRTIKEKKTAENLTLDIAQHWFLQDCAWIRKIDPQANLVTMTTTGPDPEKPVQVNIRLTGEQALDTEWSISTGSEASWHLEFVGEQGKVSLQCQDNQQLQIEPANAVSLAAHDNFLIEDIKSQLELLENGEQVLDWTDLIKLGEFGATANRSLLKRRTYPVHFEEASERSQFKSQMAAIGCGALLWAMFGMITLLAVGAVADPRDREYLTSSSADYVIWRHEFSNAEESHLSEMVEDHLSKIAASWSSTSPVLIIEEAEDSTDAVDNINQERANSVRHQLIELGVKDPASRIIVRSIEGQWFETAMLLGWIIVFLPVGLVLVAQSLLVISRPID